MEDYTAFEDEDFKKADTKTQREFVDYWVDNTYADDAEFQSADDATKLAFKEHVAEQFVPKPSENISQEELDKSQKKMDKIDEYIPDFAEDFVHGAAKNVVDYTASGAKLFGADDLQKKARIASKTLDNNIDNKLVGTVGEMLGDPVNLAPAGVFTKGAKLARVAKSVAGGAAVGATTMAAKNYGDDSLKQDDKNLEIGVGAGVVATLNGIIAGVTKGRVTNAVKDIGDDFVGAKSTDDIADSIVKNADEFGLSADEAQNVSQEVKFSAQEHLSKTAQPKISNELDQVDTGFKELEVEINGGATDEALVPKGYKEPELQEPTPEPTLVKDETPLQEVETPQVKQEPQTTQQTLQSLQSDITQANRKADFEESVDNVAGATKLREESKILQEQADTTRTEIGKELLQHPRADELLKMRESVLAKDSTSPQSTVIPKDVRHQNSGEGWETDVTPATYEKNYNYDFELTKQDVKDIRAGKFSDDTLAKLETDLGTLDNHPDYAPTPKSETVTMNDADWDEANTLFSKGIDNVVVGAYAGIDEDENGNISFDPEKFVLGLGGYTAVKSALKNGKVQGVLKEYAQKAIDTVDMNPAVSKPNGLNAMFVGTNPSAKGAFSDVATKKSMKEIDDSGAKVTQGSWGTSEDIQRGNQTYSRLGDILNHDELYKKYPELKDIKVHLVPDHNGASFDPEANRIVVGYDTKTKQINKSSLLHELQHSIQEIENWAKGGSPDGFSANDTWKIEEPFFKTRKPLEKEQESLSQKIFDAEFDGKTPTAKDVTRLEEVKKEISKINDDRYKAVAKFKLDSYKRLHGEQQARATQYRADMTPEQRASESWTDTLKKVEGEYKEPIVKFDDGGVSEMSEQTKEIKSAVKKALTAKTNTKLELGSLDDTVTKKVFDETKINLKGFSRYIDENHIRHTIKEHGDPVREAQRGQLPITEDDIAKIPEITSSFDKVTKSIITDKKGKKRTRLVFEKAYDDGTIRYVEATDFRNKKLSLKTMYKKEIGETAKNSKKSVVTDLDSSQQSGGDATQSFDKKKLKSQTLDDETSLVDESGIALNKNEGANILSPEASDKTIIPQTNKNMKANAGPQIIP